MPNQRVIGPHRLPCKVCAGEGCEVLVVIGERIQPGVRYRPPAGLERDGTYFCPDCYTSTSQSEEVEGTP
jgi:hypothetical protein